MPELFSPRWPRRLAARLVGMPVWAQALIVYGLSRVVALAIMAAIVRRQKPSPWTTGTRTSLQDFLNFWDAGWYQRIADHGYPDVLPRTPDGRVIQNQWAFHPLHPWIVRDVSAITGLDYQLVSPILSTIFAALAAILILALFRRHTTAGRALAGLAFVFFFPASPVFSTGYAESLTLLLLAMALMLVIERQYLWAIPVVVLMDLSRPVGVAFSFFMLIHLIDRFRSRGEQPYPLGEVIRSWTLGVLSCAAALIHPVHAWLRTGEITAYTDTEHAWSGGHSRVVVQWFDAANRLVGGFGPLLLFTVIGLMLALIYSPAGRQMGRTLQQFCLAYGIYLIIFFNPQTSTLRLMIPLFPMALSMAYARSWAYRTAIIITFILLQIIWVAYLWHWNPPADLPP